MAARRTVRQETRIGTYSFPELAGEERLRELILYIANQCMDDPKFGATKLNKILFFADFLSYGFLGKPITGVTYRRLPQGPAPRRLVPVREAMQAAEEIHVLPRKVYGYDQHRIVPLREADIDIFSSREIAMVDMIIREFWNRSATEVSDLSHGRAWRTARELEDIPYEAVFLSDEDATEEDIAWAKELDAEYGWDATA